MAPLTQAQAKRARDEASTSADMLPDDVLFNVLQVLPAKDVCRVRAVSRLWRSTTSHPAFIRAHADRHKEPRFVAKFWNDKRHIYVVDLSGNVLKRMAVGAGGLRVMSTRLNRACLVMEWNRCCLLNPATGGIQVLPQDPAVQHVRQLHDPFTFFALGFVASTREYKVLRAFDQPAVHCLGVKTVNRGQLFEMLTINGDTDRAQWRAKPGLLVIVNVSSGVVVDGVVYFLTVPTYIKHLDLNAAAYYIVSFDLEGEEWRTDLQLPSSIGSTLGTCKSMKEDLRTLADLKGSLVLAHLPHGELVMDLWFLLDFQSGLWVKEYSIRTGSIASRLDGCNHLKPLLVLGDGRLVFYLAPTGLLFICDPVTNTFTKVHMRCLGSVGVYTGSLLSVQEGHME